VHVALNAPEVEVQPVQHSRQTWQAVGVNSWMVAACHNNQRVLQGAFKQCRLGVRPACVRDALLHGTRQHEADMDMVLAVC
jgi:hypothetical protein